MVPPIALNHLGLTGDFKPSGYGNTENPSASPFFWITPDFLADSRLPVHFAPAESP
jgi:hypothetical protein